MTSTTISDIIKLDVGGIRYKTLLNTIVSDSDSMLASMFSGRHKLNIDEDGYYFIDRDGELFKYVLQYLKNKTLNINELSLSEVECIRDEADYFNIIGLVNLCDKKLYYSIYSMLKFFNFNTINDMKQFEFEFNDIFSIENLYKYQHSQSIIFIDIIKSPILFKNIDYKNINHNKNYPFIRITISLYDILQKQTFSTARDFIKKWNCMQIPLIDVAESDPAKFNILVKSQSFKCPYNHVNMIYVSGNIGYSSKTSWGLNFYILI